jgi:6,7-dimethyl-8-ribityllumazine synthase
MAEYDGMEEIDGGTNGEGLHIGIVVARFNAEVGDGLLASCTAELTRLGVRPDDVTIVSVPGALEAPLALQHMAQSDDYDALIALGAVIRGETYHFEIVSNESARGIAARMAQKGADCATVAVEMANLLRELGPK